METFTKVLQIRLTGVKKLGRGNYNKIDGLWHLKISQNN
jgi:hypothetical protein